VSAETTTARLTAREAEIAGHLLAGTDQRGIAGKIGVSHEAAKAHLSNIRAKLGVTQHAEMLARLREMYRTPDATIEDARRHPRTWCDI